MARFSEPLRCPDTGENAAFADPRAKADATPWTVTEPALSSPVAGTKNTLQNGALESAAPAANPVAANAVVAQALAEAAHALLKAANALLGESSFLIPAKNSPGNGACDSLPHPCHDVTTVTEVINEFLLRKANGNRSDRYLRALRVSLSSFARGRSQVPLSAVTVQDVEKWIDGLDVRPRTKKGYFSDVKTMFIYAQRRGYVHAATLEGMRSIDLPESDTHNEAPGIHTPGQVQTFLTYLQAANLDACRHMAIRYFAGIRSAETHRLREENLWLDRGVIEVPAAKAKTKSRRLVTIQPNLRAWLDLGGELRAICPETLRRYARNAGVTWAQNVTRHSFVSYHYARFENAGKTAKESGHSEQMLFAHYRALVTKEDAERFFAIMPQAMLSRSQPGGN